MITTAEQARKLTKSALSVKNENFKKLVNHVMERITAQAEAGKSELNYPFNAAPKTRGVSYQPTEAEREAVKAEFIKRGFKWIYRESQDPGSPVDCPIDTVSW